MMIARKFRFALIPAVMLAMVACNLSDQAHTPVNPASPAEPSEATVAVDSSLEGIDIDSATMDSIMRESEALGNAGLAEEELDSATLDSLIRESGTSDSAIESEALDAAMGPIAAKTSAASNPCPYGIYKWGGGTCTDPYPFKKKKGVYISPLIGRKSLNGVASPRTQSICPDNRTIQRFGVQVRVFPANKPLPIGLTHVSSILHTCGRPLNYLGPYHWLPKAHPQPTAPHDRDHRLWDGLLVGIRARSADWIDALGPIMLKNGRLSVDVFGKLNGGTPKAMLCPRNYYVAGFIGFRDKNLRHGLTGLRMVCKELPGLPSPPRRTLTQNGMPFRPAQIIVATFYIHAQHVYDKHILGSPTPGGPSKFSEILMGFDWYKTKDVNKVPLALYKLFDKAISRRFQRFTDKDIVKWRVWVESPNLIGWIFGQYGTVWTSFIFHKNDSGSPVMESAYPDWPPPAIHDEL